MHLGCINENKGKNWIRECLKYIIMFVNMQYHLAYLESTDQKIAVSDNRYASARLSTKWRSPMRPRLFLAR